MRVLALDPGVTVGWALFEGDRSYRQGQFPAEYTWRYLTTSRYDNMTMESVEPPQLVVETFVYRRLPKAVLTPVEVIGVVKEWARQHNVPIVWQTPSQAKHFFTDAQLKERSLYQVGLAHANDAMRHLLYYLTFNAKVIGVEKPQYIKNLDKIREVIESTETPGNPLEGAKGAGHEEGSTHRSGNDGDGDPGSGVPS